MRFILQANALESLCYLRFNYQIEKNIKFNEPVSLFELPIFLGGIDRVTRSTQIDFLEKIYEILKPNLCKTEDLKNPHQLLAHITAARVMLAACLYVQSNIGPFKRNSVLYRLIDDCLGITENNFLDESDKEICYLAAHRIINLSKITLEELNEALMNAELQPFTEKEWSKFSKFLDEICSTKNMANTYTNYPVTSITSPLFKSCFSTSGLSVGYLLGNTLSNSSYLTSPKYQITTAVGTTLFVICGAGTTGVALFAPLIATNLVNLFCSISLARTMSTIMGFLGQGIGMGVGYPLDLAYQLLWKFCTLIGSYSGNQSNPPLTGLRIADGISILSGLVVQTIHENKIPKNYIKQIIEIKQNSDVYINDQSLGSFLNFQTQLNIYEDSQHSLELPEEEFLENIAKTH